MGTVRRKLDTLYQDIRLINTWGLRLGAYRVFLDCFTAEQREKSSYLKNLITTRQKLIEKKIEKYYPDNTSDLEAQFSIQDQKTISRDCPIWVLWWQGIDNAPPIVKSCVDSIIEKRGNHPVIILNKDNISRYINLPDYVCNKLNEGKMTITHFSDILRFALLYEHGGVWMDATIYLSRHFDDEIYGQPLFTIKSDKPDGRKWSSFFWASSEKSQCIGTLLQYFYNYWKHEDGLIDYFLINSIIAVTYQKNEAFKKALDAVPSSNSDVMKMFEQLNSTYESLHVNDDTYINKLSYKRNWAKYTPQGELTVYGSLID